VSGPHARKVIGGHGLFLRRGGLVKKLKRKNKRGEVTLDLKPKTPEKEQCV